MAISLVLEFRNRAIVSSSSSNSCREAVAPLPCPCPRHNNAVCLMSKSNPAIPSTPIKSKNVNSRRHAGTSSLSTSAAAFTARALLLQRQQTSRSALESAANGESQRDRKLEPKPRAVSAQTHQLVRVASSSAAAAAI